MRLRKWIIALNKQDKITGCIIGGAIGDAVGGYYEGQNPPIAFSYNHIMQLSDDTQLTLATCEALSESDRVDPSIVAEHFVKWYKAGNLTGLGASTAKALKDLMYGGHWALVGRKGERAAGNGAAMRIAPVALYLKTCAEADRQIIRDVSRITHHNEEAYAGAVAVALAIQASFENSWEDHTSLFSYIIKNLPDCLLRDRMDLIIKDKNNSSLEKIADIYGCSGYVVESVPLAILGAGYVKEYGYQDMIERLIQLGGDTDTIASIAGQIAGALIGKSNLPDSMINLLPFRNHIDLIIKKFVSAVP